MELARRFSFNSGGDTANVRHKNERSPGQMNGKRRFFTMIMLARRMTTYERTWKDRPSVTDGFRGGGRFESREL
jgi:hypothetical protein